MNRIRTGGAVGRVIQHWNVVGAGSETVVMNGRIAIDTTRGFPRAYDVTAAGATLNQHDVDVTKHWSGAAIINGNIHALGSREGFPNFGIRGSQRAVVSRAGVVAGESQRRAGRPAEPE